MTKKAQALLEQALKLSATERLRLARRLEESVDESDALSAEWQDEIDRRIERVAKGRAKGVPGEEAIARVRRTLARHRSGHDKKSPR